MPDFGIINFGEAAAASSFRKRASAPSPSTSRSRRPRPRSRAVASPLPRSRSTTRRSSGRSSTTCIVVQTKVVTQTIAAGVAVARGTAVDIVLAQTGNLPVVVIPGIHQAFANLTMAQLHNQFAAVPEVRDLVRTKTDASQLTADELTTLTTALENNTSRSAPAPARPPNRRSPPSRPPSRSRTDRDSWCRSSSSRASGKAPGSAHSGCSRRRRSTGA